MRVLLFVLLAACTRHQDAKWGVRGESTCPKDRGCELAIGAEEYRAPDDQWQPDTVERVLAGRPEVSCADVGTAMAADDLGSYADPDDAAPIAQRYERACGKAKLTREERTCVYEARERKTMSYCAARLFPEVEVQILPARDCPTIIAALRERLDSLPGSKPGAWNRAVVALAESCRKDRWTREVAHCHELATGPASCLWLAPEPLRLKIADRLHQAGVAY